MRSRSVTGPPLLLGKGQSVALDVRKIEPATLMLDLTRSRLKRFDGPTTTRSWR
jgi:hypothetical protein